MTLVGFVLTSQLTILFHTLYIIIAIWMLWLIYNGIVNLKLINDRKDINLKLKEKSIEQKNENFKISNPIISEEVDIQQDKPNTQKNNDELFHRHFEKINALVVNESLYRNENLSIDDVAERIDMSVGYISKIIKKATHKNFPSWINEFRVADVKAMFVDDNFENYTTLSIGLEAGFKSKSAFYATFKKITGETPAKFRKNKS